MAQLAHSGEVESLAAEIAGLNADAAAIVQRLQGRHHELLFAMDGAGNYIGRVMQYGAESLIVAVPGVGQAVAVFLDSDNAMNGAEPGLVAFGNSLLFSEAGCAGAPFVYGEPPGAGRRSAVMDPATGDIYRATDNFVAGQQLESRRGMWPNGTCDDLSFVADVYEYELALSIGGFVPGISVGAMPF